MAIIKNPNNPIQPQEGVYRFCYIDKGVEKTLYVGESKATLKRSQEHLLCLPISSNNPNYNKLDTNFIVGTVIKILESCGFECLWEHLDNDRSKEASYCQKLQPLLQGTGTTLHKGLSIVKQNGSWKDSGGNKEAYDELFKELVNQGIIVINKNGSD